MTDDLAQWFLGARRIVVIGVGNPIRRDDNAGVEIVGRLEGKVPEYVLLIKSETIPEEFIGPIIDFKPTHILIIDSALLGLSPGSSKLVVSLESSRVAISTHFLPLQLFHDYLAKMTGAKIAMLLIQPKDTSFSEGLTPELRSARDKLVEYLTNVIESVVN